MPTLTNSQLTGNPSLGDFLGGLDANRINTNKLSLAGKNAGLRTSLQLGSFAGSNSGLELGLANIAQLIGSQGKIDPRGMNLRLADIASGTQQQVDSTRGELAAAGLQGSGVGQGILAAQQGQGQALRTREIANEQTNARQRQAQELQGLLFPLIQSIIEQQALAQGGDQFRDTQSSNRRGAEMDAIARIASSLIGGG